MKKVFFGMALLLVGAQTSNATSTAEILNAITRADLQASTMNVINWQVGDYHEFEVSLIFGKGSGTKEATQDVPDRNAVWYVTDIAILGQNQKTEALIDRATGEVLELLVNGEKQDPNEGGDFEIIEQSETEVTVPAGTFECLYVKANVEAQGQQSTVELWVNPIDVNLDGTLKMVMGSQIGPVTLSLTKFGHR